MGEGTADPKRDAFKLNWPSRSICFTRTCMWAKARSGIKTTTCQDNDMYRNKNLKRSINPADAPLRVRRLTLSCRFGKFHDVRRRALVLGCGNCIDQDVQGGASRAARLVIAAQIVAGSFKMEVGCGKVTSHGFSFCPPFEKHGPIRFTQSRTSTAGFESNMAG
ncbi:hypothetical protein MES4922_280043 [Mesorhizobium ventifaucium]|uniref:Uncharacterized protein n=1 Tax=Mesorhizobium ventifaucium TaxID=666020 RepID=A0ABM9DW96_9HYPH|nr:hypothetical protein MES4922_280043 [Mesorhizobium ventifaucium]